MSKRRPNYARAIIKVANGITREKRWLKERTIARLEARTPCEMRAVHDLVKTLVVWRTRIGPRNRRFMTRRTP